MDRLIWGAPVDGTSNSSAMLEDGGKEPLCVSFEVRSY